jgi:hypothetical protein
MDGTFKSKREAHLGLRNLIDQPFFILSGDHRGRSSDAFESNKLGATYTPNRKRPTDELPSYCFSDAGEKF